MEIIKTSINGVLIIEPRVFKDERGYFFESVSLRESLTRRLRLSLGIVSFLCRTMNQCLPMV